MRESELLFPSTSGGYRAPSCLDKPIREIASAAKIGKALTPRFMRRTFQDLGRAASVHDFVVRAISGHATTSMQEHYSSVSGDEVRTGLAKVLALAGIGKHQRTERGRRHNHRSGYAGGYANPPSTATITPKKKKPSNTGL